MVGGGGDFPISSRAYCAAPVKTPEPHERVEG